MCVDSYELANVVATLVPVAPEKMKPLLLFWPVHSQPVASASGLEPARKCADAADVRGKQQQDGGDRVRVRADIFGERVTDFELKLLQKNRRTA